MCRQALQAESEKSLLIQVKTLTSNLLAKQSIFKTISLKISIDVSAIKKPKIIDFQFQTQNNEIKQHHQHTVDNLNTFQATKLDTYDFLSCLENFVYSPPEEFDNINSYYYTDEKALLE